MSALTRNAFVPGASAKHRRASCAPPAISCVGCAEKMSGMVIHIEYQVFNSRCIISWCMKFLCYINLLAPPYHPGDKKKTPPSPRTKFASGSLFFTTEKVQTPTDTFTERSPRHHSKNHTTFCSVAVCPLSFWRKPSRGNSAQGVWYLYHPGDKVCPIVE